MSTFRQQYPAPSDPIDMDLDSKEWRKYSKSLLYGLYGKCGLLNIRSGVFCYLAGFPGQCSVLIAYQLYLITKASEIDTIMRVAKDLGYTKVMVTVTPTSSALCDLLESQQFTQMGDSHTNRRTKVTIRTLTRDVDY